MEMKMPDEQFSDEWFLWCQMLDNRRRIEDEIDAEYAEEDEVMEDDCE